MTEISLKYWKETHRTPDLVYMWLPHESSTLNLCTTLYHGQVLQHPTLIKHIVVALNLQKWLVASILSCQSRNKCHILYWLLWWLRQFEEEESLWNSKESFDVWSRCKCSFKKRDMLFHKINITASIMKSLACKNHKALNTIENIVVNALCSLCIVMKTHCFTAFLNESITRLFTWLIAIDIAPLTVLFCNCPLFYNCPLADLYLPSVKEC